MVFLWDSHWVPMRFLWYFYDVSMGFLQDSYGIPMAFLGEFHDVSMIFLWDYFGMSIESKLKSIDNKFKLN